VVNCDLVNGTDVASKLGHPATGDLNVASNQMMGVNYRRSGYWICK